MNVNASDIRVSWRACIFVVSHFVFFVGGRGGGERNRSIPVPGKWFRNQEINGVHETSMEIICCIEEHWVKYAKDVSRASVDREVMS